MYSMLDKEKKKKLIKSMYDKLRNSIKSTKNKVNQLTQNQKIW